MQKFVEIQPDIVLVDTGLAGTSGYQICELIKADENTHHLPVLLIVGSFEPFDQEEAARVGADGFLTKPFDSKQELVERVRDLLGVIDSTGGQAGSDADSDSHEAKAIGGANGVEPTDDIENIYNSSFAATAEIEEFDTIDDLFSNSGLDDELIETTYVADDFREFVQTPKSDEAEVEWVTAEQDGAASELKAEESPPQALSEEPPRREASTVKVGGYFDAESLADPSPELIALITERVIERMSDRVIREIAVEAVPRIADRLIREALEDEKKS
jgi:hypothetical protein